MARNLQVGLQRGLRGSISGGLGANDIFTTASLDLNFAKYKNLGTVVDATTGSNLVDFTRASSGTYVGSDGLIKTATTNLVTYSEEFDNGAWANVAGTVTRTANATLAPNGTLTADQIVIPSANVGIANSVTIVSGLAYAVSIWMKGTAGETIRFTANSISGGGNVTLTGDWQRFTFTGTASGTSGSVNISTFGGATARTLYVWGAQLEQSTTVGEYVKTTSTINSAPRFDHDPTTGESLGLLVEEARTNSIRNNTMVGAVAGTPGTVPTNWLISQATGNLTTREIVGIGTENGIAYIDVRFVTSGSFTASVYADSSTGVAASNGQTWTASYYVKLVGGSLTNVTFQTSIVENDSSGNFLAGADSAAFIPTTAALITQRIIQTRTNTNASTAHEWSRIRFNFSGAGDVTLRIGLPQLEQGAFATSVIPTSTATVTRAADVASISGSNFGTFRTNLLQYSEEFDQSIYTKEGVTVNSNSITAPDNTHSADYIQENTAATRHRVYQNDISVLSGTTYTASIYAKSSTRNVLINANSLFNARSSFSLTGDGSVLQTDSGSATITNVGNGWYRCTVIGTASSTATGSVFYQAQNGSSDTPYTGDGTSGLYIWGAQLEQGSTATDYIKSDVNWTSRASNATYYDVNGTLKKSSYNLLLRSEEFDNASWTKTRSSVSPNAAIAPDGLLTADKLVEDTSTNNHICYQTPNLPAAYHSFSAYVKSAERTQCALRVDTSTASRVAVFDLTPGTVLSSDSLLTSRISPVQNGWFRVSVSLTTAETVINAIVMPATGGIFAYTGDGTSGIYIWGAQLETGDTVGDYAKTTTTAASTARTAAYLPDGNGNFVSAGPLLLEAAGTNLLLRSEEFGTWWTPARASVTANAATAPNGQVTANTLIEDTTATNNHVLYSGSPQGAGTYSFSIYAKAAGRSHLLVTQESGGNSLFTLSGTGTASALGANTVSITNVGNGWYRCTSTYTATGAHFIYFNLHNGTTNVYTGDGTSGIYIWGAQLEQSSYPTSYIPTSGSTATRAADVSTSAATTVFESDWYRQDEGTFYADLVTTSRGHNGYPRLIGTFGSDINATNEFSIYTRNIGTGDDYKFYGVITDGVTAGDLNPPAGSPVGSGKVAFAAKVNDGALAVSGLTPVTDNTLGMNTAAQLLFFSNARYQPRTSGYIRRLTYWPARLPNSTLQTITN